MPCPAAPRARRRNSAPMAEATPGASPRPPPYGKKGLDAGSWMGRCAGLYHFDREGMYAGLEFVVDGSHDGAMLLHPAQAGEAVGGDAHPEMGGPALAPAGVAAVFLAFVDHFKMAGNEFDRKFLCNRVTNGHMDTGSTGLAGVE